MGDEIAGYFPWHADWWRAHASMPPTLILRCGIGGCGNRVGEVKTDGDDVVVLIYHRFGDRTVPFTPRVTEESLGFSPGTVLREANTGETLTERQDRKFEELDAETIRYVDVNTRVAKRYNAKPVAMPIEVLGHIVCPDSRHGIVDLPDPDSTIADIRKLLTSPMVGHASKRPYVIFRDNPVE
ncbi:hypothetical protein TM48_03971 [Mycobacterium shottsii]|uniref:Uncharacterized protein n=1 Tax=Mycobacterium shottsii TaxID=133549 RepID=A0A7I7LK74_9MYCO|nr:hypothetical protein [Mycobacterium shottsii]QYL29483.1 hypothetical protein TM48_03971 [Mycobacterium shottsii]BBX59783.1 hypothetical protein MSHO_51280 [Mycobacterium shottsii]